MRKILLTFGVILFFTNARANNDDWNTRYTWANTIHNIPAAKNYRIEDAQKFGRDFTVGALKGDFIKQPNFANLLGNFASNFTPAAPAVNFRDAFANIKNLFTGDFQGNKLMKTFTAASVIPVVADFKNLGKAFKAGKEARELTKLAKLGSQGLEITGRFVTKVLPPLKPGFKATFDGPVIAKTFLKGDIIYRAPSGAGELAKNPGRWFGMAAVDTSKGMDKFYDNMRFGNKNEMVRSYEVTENFTAYFGKVKNGIGYQLLIPDQIQEASEVLKWKSTLNLTNKR